MRIAIIALAWLIMVQGSTEAASRTWKNRKGQETKAEFIGGVLDNKIVLKLPGNQRLYVRLSEFSLADRDYLVDWFTKRKDPDDIKKLASIMVAENQVPVVNPDLKTTDSGGENGGGLASGRMPAQRNPFNPLAHPNVANQPAEVETEMYGLPLPSPELLVEDQVRTWTDLLGRKQLATFDRLLAPGFLRLKKSDGRTFNLALVNFSREDIDYVKQALQNDLARPVFPEGNGFQSLTPDDVGRGYRVWTDRKNVTLIGKFIALKGKNVVIEVAGQQQEYPKAGLSETDKSWVDGEIERRQEAARAAAAAAAQQASTNHSTTSPFGRSRFGPNAGGHGENSAGNTGSRFGTGSGSLFTYSFQCRECGHSWTDSISISRCPQCKDKRHFRCYRCGHKWTRTDNTLIDHCPKCSGQLAGSGHSGSHSEQSVTNTSTFDSSSQSSLASTSPSGSSTKSGQGLLMTVIYVVLGLSVLAGIAAGLFRAFG